MPFVVFVKLISFSFLIFIKLILCIIYLFPHFQEFELPVEEPAEETPDEPASPVEDEELNKIIGDLGVKDDADAEKDEL